MKPPQSFKTSLPPSMPGSTHLIFAGGGRPLSHAAWVMGHLDLTLYVSLIHSFVLSKKPIKQTLHKNVFSMLSNAIKNCVCQRIGDSPVCVDLWTYEEAVNETKETVNSEQHFLKLSCGCWICLTDRPYGGCMSFRSVLSSSTFGSLAQ